VHDEFEALLQVSCVAQWVTFVHSAHVSCVPSWRYLPVVQVVHCEFAALEQVIELVQNGMGVQAWQTSARSPPAATSWRKDPLAQLVHCELVAVVQVSSTVQLEMSVQARHSSLTPLAR
jgi:hypothetical protein